MSAQKLTPKQRRFVEEYLVDLNATQAATRAGYSAKTAVKIGSENLRKPAVAEAIAAARLAQSERTGIDADTVLRGLADLASADARDLVEYRRACCRYCWGEGFRYHRTAGELERARREHEAQGLAARGRKVPAFDEEGGAGYHAKRAPNPECPECFGDGVGQTFLHDTRGLSRAAARLYAGVKQTRDGLEVKLHSPPDALVQLGRHLGLFKDRTELTGKDGSPIVLQVSEADAKA